MSGYNRGLAVLCVFGLAATSARADDLDHLLCFLPDSSNATTMINVKAIRQSSSKPVEGSGYEIIGGMVIPPYVDRIVYATHVAPGEMAVRKTGGAMRLNRAMKLEDIADQTSGEIINVGDQSIVSHPTRGYFALLTPETIGFAQQVTRQDVARYMQFCRTNPKAVLGPYLMEAVVAAGDAPIVSALDLEHMFEPKVLRERLALSSAMVGKDQQAVDSMAQFISGLRGIRLMVRGQNLQHAEVVLDFAAPVGERGEIVKVLLLEALDDFGAALPDLRTAKVSAEGNAVKLQIKLSDAGLIRIMSLFLPPTPPPLPAKLESNGVSIAATGSYFRSVNRLVDELKRQVKKTADFDPSLYDKSSLWHDSFAKRMDQLSTRYVDPDMAAYGSTEAAKLRSLAYSLKGLVVEWKALESGMIYLESPAGVIGPWGWRNPNPFGPSSWFGPHNAAHDHHHPPLPPGTSAAPGVYGGGSQIESNVASLREKQAELVRQDAGRRLGIWESMDSDRREIAKKMKDRYGIDIEKPIR